MHEPRNIQPPYTASDFWNQWSSVNPRMALFILVTPQSFWTSVSPVGFTSNTRDMTLPGHGSLIFHSSPGITPTVVEQSLGEAGNLEMTGIYQDSIFEREDVLAGKWNFARVEVFSASWDKPYLGELVHFAGNSGEISDMEISFKADLRGDIDKLRFDTNVVTQRTCRVREFRDATCGHTAPTVVIDGATYNIVETGIPDGAFAPGDTYWYVQFNTPTTPPANFYRNGKIKILNGNNAGISREIAWSDGGDGMGVTFQLKRPFPFLTGGFETVELTAGCVHTLEDCAKYGNAINFRGEPFVPGVEAMNRVRSAN